MNVNAASMLRVLGLLLSLLLPASAADTAADAGADVDEKTSAGKKRIQEARTAETMFKDVTWVKGPASGQMRSQAEIKVPSGFRYADGEGTRTVLKRFGNLTSGAEVGLLAPQSMDWFVVFEFDATGYVKDDDKDKLDAAKMLKSIKEGTERANEVRKERGLPTMKIIGWDQEPHYDSETHNLEWALRGESEGGQQVVNYNTRLLGRRGVMEAQLVVEPDRLEKTLPEFKKLLEGYEFRSGERYAEYRQGDKLAAYGLAALVTGGAVAIAAKTGLLTAAILFFKKFFKLVIVAIVGVCAWVKKLFTGRSSQDHHQLR
ncbi:MAG: DUF2167 domain-containing protein [Verrucomicrobia bacterium]|nr:DUF2167 domain-containing protein [Verrucomicrobiota bacterium]MBI3869605.1 DUF2167 domain-containing protein [Verrucomicrobiota bacterium]